MNLQFELINNRTRKFQAQNKMQQQTYKVIFIDHHVILEIPVGKELRYGLIDTGAPTTLSSHSTLPLCGKQYKTYPSLGTIDTSSISQLMNHKLDYLIGNDVLCKHSCEISSSKMTFYPEDHVLSMMRLNLCPSGEWPHFQ